MKEKKLIIFGEGSYAEIAHQYFSDDSEYEVVCFTKDDDFIESDQYLGLPMVPFSKIQGLYPPDSFAIHIALSYTEMNHLRERKFEDNTVQPFVKIEDNVILWSGNHIGHHSVIESHNFISSHVVISGHCHVDKYCFLGVNSTVGHGVKIGKETLLGAGAIVSKNTEEGSVYVPAKSVKLERHSSSFKL
jgi:hypothetical protein